MTQVIRNISELQETIDRLELQKAAEEEQLIAAFKTKMDSLKPRNLIRSSVSELKNNNALPKKIAIVGIIVTGAVLLKKIVPPVYTGALKKFVVTAALSLLLKAAMSNKR